MVAENHKLKEKTMFKFRYQQQHANGIANGKISFFTWFIFIAVEAISLFPIKG